MTSQQPDRLTDFHGWAMHQVHLLREGFFPLIDADAIADELERLARQELRRLQLAYYHLLKALLEWQYLADHRTDYCRHVIILKRQCDIPAVLSENRSLRSVLAEIRASVYRTARYDFLIEHRHVHPDLAALIPEQCPFTEAQALDLDWLPEPVPTN